MGLPSFAKGLPVVGSAFQSLFQGQVCALGTVEVFGLYGWLPTLRSLSFVYLLACFYWALSSTFLQRF